MDILFSAYGPFGAPTRSVAAGEAGAVGGRGGGPVSGACTDCTRCTTPLVRAARAWCGWLAPRHHNNNPHFLGGVVGACGALRVERGLEGRPRPHPGVFGKLVIWLVQVVRPTRPPPKRCGSQLASSRVSTAHHVPVIPIVVTRHISWRVATNSDRESSVFPFPVGRKSARGGVT